MRNWLIGLAGLVLTMALAGCSGSVTTANITNAVLAKDYKDSKAVNTTSTFAPTDTMHCVVDVANAPDGTKVKAAWTAVDTTAGKDVAISEKESTANGSGTIDFTLTKDTPWPTGKYKVDVYLDGKLNTTKEFTVES